METDRDISSTAWILGKVETEADWAHHTLFRYIFPITFLVGNFACSCQDFALPQYCFRVFLIFIYKMAAATKSSLYSIWWATQLLRGSSSSLGSVCYSWIASQFFYFFYFLKRPSSNMLLLLHKQNQNTCGLIRFVFRDRICWNHATSCVPY